MRATFGDAKDPDQCGIAALINVSPNDPRFASVLNLAIKNLLETGEMFYGSHQRIQFCVESGCLVQPRQVAAIEEAALCNHPIPVRNRWYEFLETGIGLQTERTGNASCNSNSCGAPQMIDRGNVCAFSDIINGTGNKKIKVYADVAEDADAEILLQGYDENNQWIRTQVAGEWIDGEYVSINAAVPQLSTKFFSSLAGVQKPLTNGTVRLYEYDTTLLTQRAIAIYEPDETRPWYRKYFIPGLEGNGCCGCAGDDADTKQVTVMAKLAYVPVRNDLDWLLISNFSALESEVQSIMKRRNNLAQEAVTWRALAVQTLRDELRHYLGRGAINPMRMQPRRLAGAGVRTLL